MRCVAAVVLLVGSSGITAAVNRPTEGAPERHQSAGASQVSPAPAAALAPAVDGIAAALLKDAHVPGAAVAVVRQGSVVYSAGFGRASVETGLPVTPRTPFQIGSISKPFTAFAVMALVEDGRLRLDDPLGRHLDVPKAWTRITIRHLLNHTAGLWDWEADGALAYDREYSDREFITLIDGHPLEFEPGTQHRYTNSGYPLLGMVVRKITGAPFETYVERRVFRRAGMRETRFWRAANREQGGYVWRDGMWVPGVATRPRVLAPNGGIISTALDMALFVRAVRDDRIVRQATLEAMWSPPILPDGTRSPYGIGWFVQRWQDRRMVHHIGETVAGFSSSLQIVPDADAAVVVLANASGVLPVYVASRDIAAAVLASIDRPGSRERGFGRYWQGHQQDGSGRHQAALAPVQRPVSRRDGCGLPDRHDAGVVCAIPANARSAEPFATNFVYPSGIAGCPGWR